jgi:DNA repair protein RadC
MHAPVFDDILALGAHAMPDAALVRILLPDVGRARAESLTQALLLDPHARAEVLRHEIEGPLLLAALELGRRAAIYPARGGVRVRGPSDVAELVLPRLPVDVERVIVLALDARLHLARVVVTGDGGAHFVDANFAHVLGPVLAAGCTRFVVAHRHIDGTAHASFADQAGTVHLAAAARGLGLTLVDHVIVGDDGFTSLRREGQLPATRGYR